MGSRFGVTDTLANGVQHVLLSPAAEFVQTPTALWAEFAVNLLQRAAVRMTGPQPVSEEVISVADATHVCSRQRCVQSSR